ncbi:hypothetical protein SUDANB66_06484 (plasmid) [Streptomyces sp. SudanB66_2053]
MAIRSSNIASLVGSPVAIPACSPRRIPVVISSSHPGSSSTTVSYRTRYVIPGVRSSSSTALGSVAGRCGLHADKRGIRHRIARKGIESAKRLGRHRWVVEGTVSWLAGCCRLHRRYERKAEHFLAFVGIVATLICHRRLVRMDGQTPMLLISRSLLLCPRGSVRRPGPTRR